MKAFEQIQQSLDQRAEKIADYLERLSLAAEFQQKRLNGLKDTIVWMQSNAVTMKPAGDAELSAADKVQRAAQQQGLSVASQQSGGQIQIAVMHENYAVLANFLTQLAQLGLSIEKMELSSEAGQIKLTASVQ